MNSNLINSKLNEFKFDEFKIWWIQNLMNSKFDEFKIWWIQNLINSKFDELKFDAEKILLFQNLMNSKFNEFKIWWNLNLMNLKFDEFGSSKKLVKNRVCLSFDGPSTFYRGRWCRNLWSGGCSPNAREFLFFVVDATKTSVEYFALRLTKAKAYPSGTPHWAWQ